MQVQMKELNLGDKLMVMDHEDEVFLSVENIVEQVYAQHFTVVLEDGSQFEGSGDTLVEILA